MKRKKRLTDSEIRSAVEKIRSRYADYMVRFQKDRSALDSFEDRYIGAMRVRMDLALFLHAEKTAIEELIDNEEKRILASSQRESEKKQQARQQQSIADRVLEENLKRIAHYPRLLIHTDASEEVERLFGGLGTFERELWADLERLLRRAYTSMIMSPRARVEEQVLKLCVVGANGVPPRASRYQSLFERFPRNYFEIEKEGKKCMLDAAFFLHDLSDILKEVGQAEDLTAAERQKVASMAEYVHTMLEDFRLKEFKNLQR